MRLEKIVRQEPPLKLINMESVEVEEIKWLLYPFIPYGKVTIIQGDPGEGKTTMVLQIIAKLTRGKPILPASFEKRKEPERADAITDENKADMEVSKNKQCLQQPVNVIYQTAEDGLGDTIKPRLLAAGADCSKVLVIDDREQPLTMLDIRLEEAIIQTKARLVVLDPIQGFLGSDVDMHRANEIRPVMKRVAVLAEKYQCAIILIGHMNKNNNGKSSYRGLGSIDFQAAARSVLIVGRIKEKPETRVVCHVKSSLAPEGKSIAFRLDKDNGFEWIGEYDISADELLCGDSRGQKSRQAKEFLQKILTNGGMAQRKIEEEAKQEKEMAEKCAEEAEKELENLAKQRAQLQPIIDKVSRELKECRKIVLELPEAGTLERASTYRDKKIAPLFNQMKGIIAGLAAQIQELNTEIEKWKEKYKREKQICEAVKKDLSKALQRNQYLQEEKEDLLNISERYSRVVRVLGNNTVKEAIQKDIQREMEIEENRRKEQSSGKSILELLKQEKRKSMMENQYQRPGKKKYRGMEI